MAGNDTDTMTIDAHTHPVHAAFARLTGDADGYVLELPPGVARVRVSGVGAFIWRSIDGRTDLDTIARDLADMRETDRSEELSGLIVFVEQLLSATLLEVHTPDDHDATGRTDDPLEGEGVRPPFPDAWDFIMNPYPMSADPSGRPGSRDILLAAFPEGSPQRAAVEEVTGELLDALGPDRVAWGIKLDGADLTLELYFYPHRHEVFESPAAFFERARTVIERVLGWDAPRTFPIGTYLVTFETGFDGARLRAPTELDFYPRIDGGAGMNIAYRLDDRSYRMKNVYGLFTYPQMLDDIEDRLEASRWSFVENVGVASEYWTRQLRDLRTCSSVFTSFKPDSDAIYFSLVEAQDLTDFLDRFAYPPHLLDWVREHVELIDHLRYDLSFDYTVERGEVRVHKTGFYGYF